MPSRNMFAVSAPVIASSSLRHRAHEYVLLARRTCVSIERMPVRPSQATWRGFLISGPLENGRIVKKHYDSIGKVLDRLDYHDPPPIYSTIRGQPRSDALLDEAA